MTSTNPICCATCAASSPPASSYPKLNRNLRAVFWHLMGHMDEDDAYFDREATEVLLEIDEMIRDGATRRFSWENTTGCRLRCTE